MFFIQTLIEFAVAGFIIWGLFNESKLVDFEDKIAAKFKKNAPCSSDSNYYRAEVSSSENRCA